MLVVCDRMRGRCIPYATRSYGEPTSTFVFVDSSCFLERGRGALITSNQNRISLDIERFGKPILNVEQFGKSIPHEHPCAVLKSKSFNDFKIALMAPGVTFTFTMFARGEPQNFQQQLENIGYDASM